MKNINYTKLIISLDTQSRKCFFLTTKPQLVLSVNSVTIISGQEILDLPNRSTAYFIMYLKFNFVFRVKN